MDGFTNTSWYLVHAWSTTSASHSSSLQPHCPRNWTRKFQYRNGSPVESANGDGKDARSSFSERWYDPRVLSVHNAWRMSYGQSSFTSSFAFVINIVRKRVSNDRWGTTRKEKAKTWGHQWVQRDEGAKQTLLVLLSQEQSQCEQLWQSALSACDQIAHRWPIGWLLVFEYLLSHGQ